MVRYAFHMTEKQNKKLEEVAEKLGIGIPELMRRILQLWKDSLEKGDRDTWAG